MVGLALLPTALVALLVALSTLDNSRGSVPRIETLASGIVGAVLLTAFVTRAVRRGGASLIDLRLFADRSFRGGAVMMFVLGVTTWGRCSCCRCTTSSFAAVLTAAGLATTVFLPGRSRPRSAQTDTTAVLPDPGEPSSKEQPHP